MTTTTTVDDAWIARLQARSDVVAPEISADADVILRAGHRRRTAHRARLAGGVAAVALVLGAGAVTADRVVDGLTDQARPAVQGSRTPTPEQVRMFERTLVTFAHDNGVVDPPAVAVVEWIPVSAVPDVMARCLSAAGFKATATSGGFELSYQELLAPDVLRAQYVCMARYPVLEPPGADDALATHD